ncbi:hypothetical protein C9374_012654 [Naegleria lovaniensis]|uniref:Uncharacterized protein n=1 Tax=Naegleria lovaniensis TaxID=51637 RepID=A0AA88H3G5_NAELO|nr:uncharacterized protein C9374_012654 [Naegleria lovaniensis]KAG2392402.1 hypothetical protein C9374_012654 [Naegleria lovaniensis]
MMKSLKQRTQTFDIIIVGGSNVGKHSLATAFQHFQFQSKLFQIFFNSIQFDECTIKGRVFTDVSTMGQRFGALNWRKKHPADGVLYVLDVSKTVEENLDEFRKWNSFVLQQGLVKSKCLNVVVGNKNDLSCEERKMTYHEGLELSKRIGIPFYVETNVYRDNFNLFEMMLQNIYIQENEMNQMRSDFVIDESDGMIMKTEKCARPYTISINQFPYQKAWIIAVLVVLIIVSGIFLFI